MSPVRALCPPLVLLLAFAGIALGACTPKAEITVKPPSEPITINLNVKIEHEIRIKVDKDLESLFDEDEGLF